VPVLVSFKCLIVIYEAPFSFITKLFAVLLPGKLILTAEALLASDLMVIRLVALAPATLLIVACQVAPE
jgi:hypothetical protein